MGTVILLQEEEAGWSFKEEFRKILLTFTKSGMNMKMDSVILINPMHCLTNTGSWELRIDLTFTDGAKTYMHYKNFSVGSAYHQYQLNLSGFVGVTPVDPFSAHKLDGQPFSTVDRLNYGTCARNGHGSNSPGGWWYKSCFHINLNYNYGGPDGFVYFGSKWQSPSFIEMKIRPTTCSA
ncbi:ficolin-1-A-like [Dysidea avara]|uniref:ficolin-1-A-like n=1 Tax=Dysidea avara TaxID=196820 RepID=UPI0033249363